MATMITAECINCGACEPECPNTAIYQGGVEWELNGVKHPPLSQDVFYIVPEKCTECVGFFDHEACAAVCPVDVCIPDPNIPETEEQLIARAKVLHPEMAFPAEFPSRFHPGRAEGAPAAPAPAAAGTGAPAATAAPPAAPPAAAAAAPARPAAPAGAKVERPLSAPQVAPRPPRLEKQFPGELSMSFEEAAALLSQGSAGGFTWAKLLAALGQPILGALPYKHKQAIELAVGDRAYFSAAGATGLNALHNFLIYPIAMMIIGVLFFKHGVFTEHLRWFIFLGLVVALVETIWRMREGFRGLPSERIVYRGALYGLPLVPLAAPVVRMVETRRQQGSVGQDGFTDARFEDKLERERRYGEVYRLIEETNGYLLQLEFPRKMPPSGIREQIGLGDEMPDYDYDIRLQNGMLVVKGTVTDPNVRKVAAVSPAFPPDFTQSIKLPSRVAGFRHRFVDKSLEVALPRKI